MVSHHVRGVFGKLFDALKSPPATVMAHPPAPAPLTGRLTAAPKVPCSILEEDSINSRKRHKALKQKEALEKVSIELGKYGVSEPEPRPAPPAELICPIGKELMNDPVSAADGHVYERKHIQQWLDRHPTSAKSPLNGEVLAHRNLTPCHPIRSQARVWAEKHPEDEADGLGFSLFE